MKNGHSVKHVNSGVLLGVGLTMAHFKGLEYSELLNQAISLVKTHPKLCDSLLDKCHHWKGEADRPEVSELALIY